MRSESSDTSGARLDRGFESCADDNRDASPGAPSSASPGSGDATRAVFILSIGDGVPETLPAVAKGLGVHVQALAGAVYRAPSIVATDMAADIADELAAMLDSLGYTVAVGRIGDHDIEPPQLDMSVSVPSDGDLLGTLAVLSKFLGAEADEILKLLGTPPGIVMSRVSPATVEALTRRLDGIADVAAADPDSSTYCLYMESAPDNPRLAASLSHDLGRAGPPEPGILATGLSRARAMEIWSRYSRTGAVLAVNEGLLRYDVSLTHPPAAPGPEAVATLSELTGIPTTHVARVCTHAPVTLVEARLRDDADAICRTLREAGFAVAKEAASFLKMDLRVTGAADEATLRGGLSSVGVALPDQPITWPVDLHLSVGLPELQARLVTDVLAGRGVRVEMVDAQLRRAAA